MTDAEAGRDDPTHRVRVIVWSAGLVSLVLGAMLLPTVQVGFTPHVPAPAPSLGALVMIPLAGAVSHRLAGVRRLATPAAATEVLLAGHALALLAAWVVLASALVGGPSAVDPLGVRCAPLGQVQGQGALLVAGIHTVVGVGFALAGLHLPARWRAALPGDPTPAGADLQRGVVAAAAGMGLVAALGVAAQTRNGFFDPWGALLTGPVVAAWLVLPALAAASLVRWGQGRWRVGLLRLPVPVVACAAGIVVALGVRSLDLLLAPPGSGAAIGARPAYVGVAAGLLVAVTLLRGAPVWRGRTVLLLAAPLLALTWARALVGVSWSLFPRSAAEVLAVATPAGAAALWIGGRSHEGASVERWTTRAARAGVAALAVACLPVWPQRLAVWGWSVPVEYGVARAWEDQAWWMPAAVLGALGVGSVLDDLGTAPAGRVDGARAVRGELLALVAVGAGVGTALLAQPPACRSGVTPLVVGVIVSAVAVVVLRVVLAPRLRFARMPSAAVVALCAACAGAAAVGMGDPGSSVGVPDWWAASVPVALLAAAAGAWSQDVEAMVR